MLNIWFELNQFIATGGWVLWVIFANLVLLLWLALDRLVFFYRDFNKRKSSLTTTWLALPNLHTNQASDIRTALLSQGQLECERGLILLKTLIIVCPLLGLMGTVTGMIEVFDVLSITGSSNARAMASGIGRATIPTMAGMMVAILGLLLQSRILRLSKKAQQQLANQLTFHPKGTHHGGQI